MSKLSPESARVARLQPEEIATFAPHKAEHRETGKRGEVVCRIKSRVSKEAHHKGFKIRTWHTPDGRLYVERSLKD